MSAAENAPVKLVFPNSTIQAVSMLSGIPVARINELGGVEEESGVVTCLHCGEPLREHCADAQQRTWVHERWGGSLCWPQQQSSPRAEPEANTLAAAECYWAQYDDAVRAGEFVVSEPPGEYDPFMRDPRSLRLTEDDVKLLGL